MPPEKAIYTPQEWIVAKEIINKAPEENPQAIQNVDKLKVTKEDKIKQVDTLENLYYGAKRHTKPKGNIYLAVFLIVIILVLGILVFGMYQSYYH